MLRTLDLDKLNSMTKYPSIPTYHALGEKGALLEETIVFDGEIVLTEKVDGTNSRIILFPDGDYVLGSREELLYAKGDLIGNPALGIVKALKSVAESLPVPHMLTVLYLELYGGKVTAASKQYTSDQSVGWRLFDIAFFENPLYVLNMPVPSIAAWRDKGGQNFLNESQLLEASAEYRLKLTPRLQAIDSLPTDIVETHEFLKQQIPATQVALDPGAGCKSEGIVARTKDRSTIAKLRFEDYERHLKRV